MKIRRASSAPPIRGNAGCGNAPVSICLRAATKYGDAGLAGRMRSGYHRHAIAKRFDEIHAEAVEATMRCISDFAVRIKLTLAELAASARPMLENLGEELIARIPTAAAIQIGDDPVGREYRGRFQERIDGALRDIEIGFVGGRNMAVAMKDADRRAAILRWFYEQRHKADWVSLPNDQPASSEEIRTDINICRQLDQNGLIRWNGMDRLGLGQITASGVDVIEGNAAPAIPITIDKRSYSISHSVGVQIGDGNVQGDARVKMMFDAVERASATPAQKAEAKSLLEKVVENQTLWTVIAGMIGFGGPSPAA